MRKLWKTLIILIVLVGTTAGLYAWSRSKGKGDGGVKEVEVVTGSIVEKAVAVGQIQPRQKFQVKSKISGIVRRALVQVGDTVQAGDPLFEIGPDPTPLEVTEVDRKVESSDASYRRAEGDYNRAMELSRSGGRRATTTARWNCRGPACCRNPRSRRRRKRSSSHGLRT